MKKIITCIVLLALCLTMFAACGSDDPAGPDKLTPAKDYLYSTYKDAAEITPSDYQRMAVVTIDGVAYSVTWTVDVADGVKIVPAEDGKTVTVDVNEKAAADIAYKLTATIKDADGKSIEVSFNHKVPAFKELSYAEYVAAADDAPVVVKGVVTAIISKSLGCSYNCLYFQDNDGAYYAYDLTTDPVEDGIEIGMTVRVTGTRDTYSGTYEVVKGTTEIISSEKAPATPVDYTALFTAATALNDATITEKQSLLVTLKNVEISGEDEANGYYKFKLGSLESYVRISSSVCPIISEDKAGFKSEHASHLGWTANATGIICLYDGAFYLTPVDASAFEYIGLPTRTDAEMVAFEKENLSIATAITKDAVIDLPATGNGYEQVAIAWASDNDCAVIADGKLTITLPEAEASVKITATITCGEATETVEFTLAVDAASSDLYIAKPVAAPEADTGYKFALYQTNLGATLYFTGEMSGNYFATSDKADKAVDVLVEAVEGGFRLYFTDGEAKTYLDIYEYTEGKVGVRLTAEPTAVYTFNADMKIYVANVAGADYYLGTYKTYNTISASKTDYITGDNASKVGVSQFVAQLSTLAPAITVATPADAPAAETAYKFSLYQTNLGATLYFTGAMSGNYFATSDKADKAVDVFVEAVEGGFRLFFNDGEAKTYLDIYEYTEGKVGVRLTAEPTAVYTFNADAKIYVANVAGADYYLGTYKTYNTISASKTDYITGDNASKVGVSQFVAQLTTVSVAEVAINAVAEPAADTDYMFSLYQTNLGTNLYFTGAMSGNYFATSDKLSKAVDVFVEAVEGGFRLYFNDGEAKTYLDIYEYATGKVGVRLTAEPTAVYTFNADAKIYVANVAGADYYLGTYKTYNTISASKTDYITGDNASKVGVSQFVAQLTLAEVVA